MSSPGIETCPALVDRPVLKVDVTGTDAPQVHELRAEHPLSLVGRNAQSDLLLRDVEVSRRHALLARWEGAVYCLDLASRGGTRVGSVGDSFGWLTQTAQAQIGPYRLAIKVEADVVGTLPALHRDPLPHDRSFDWQLEFVSGDVQPGSYVLRRPLTLIGRIPPCKIQLKLPNIKSVHAALLVAPDGLYLRDLSGRCAVRVDGLSWLGGWLQDGQVIELGEVRIRVTRIPALARPRIADAETDDPAGGATLEACVALHSPAIPHFAPGAVPESGSSSGSVPEIDVRTADVPGSSAKSLASPASRERSIADVVLGGRYKVVKRLARGGMGVVYKGLDTRLHRIVAIKVVRASGGAAMHGRRRLLREAMICSRFDQPNIVRVLDVDKQGRYAVFEFVSGETLGDRLRRDGRIAPAQAARWMMQVADAIEHAGSQGVVHRDIKPANILIAPCGAAKLVDFGLSYLADAGDSEVLATLTEETERPRQGIAIGTAPFASPEQFENSQSVDTRSDIYSAGCTLFSLLAGRPPFFGTLSETFRQHCEAPVPAMPGMPDALAAIVEKCLAKKPADRYQTGGELAADLRLFGK